MGRASPSSRPIPAPLRAPVCQRAATLIAALLQFHRRSCGLTAPLLLALRTPRRSYTASAESASSRAWIERPVSRHCALCWRQLERLRGSFSAVWCEIAHPDDYPPKINNLGPARATLHVAAGRFLSA